MNSFPNGFVKGVVDIEKELIALDADMHYELAMGILDADIEAKATEVICRWIQF